MKVFYKVMALMLALILSLSVTGTITPASAKVSISCGGDYNEDCEIKEYSTMEDFAENHGSSVAFCTVGEDLNASAWIKFDMDCIVFVYGVGNKSFSYPRIYTDSSMTTFAKGINKEGKTVECKEVKDCVQLFCKSGTTYYFNCNHSASFTIGYQPLDSYKSLISMKKTKNGIDVTATAKSSNRVRLLASEDTVSASTYLDKGKGIFLIGDDIYEKEKDTITLPSAGKYTLCLSIADSTKTVFTYILLPVNTKDFISGSGSSAKLANPLVAMVGTNVIVGYATPNTKVTAKISKKTYTATSDSTGLYAIKTSTLKKSTKIKLYEEKDSKNAITVKAK